MNQRLTSHELEDFEIPTGRGYKAAEVEAFRTHAISALRHLERRVTEMESAIETLRSDSAGAGSQMDLAVLLQHADPTAVVAASATAAGQILRLAVEAANQHSATAQSALALQRNKVVSALEAAIAVARDGRRADYELHQVVLEASRVLDQLQLATLRD